MHFQNSVEQPLEVIQLCFSQNCRLPYARHIPSRHTQPNRTLYSPEQEIIHYSCRSTATQDTLKSSERYVCKPRLSILGSSSLVYKRRNDLPINLQITIRGMQA